MYIQIMLINESSYSLAQKDLSYLSYVLRGTHSRIEVSHHLPQ